MAMHKDAEPELQSTRQHHLHQCPHYHLQGLGRLPHMSTDKNRPSSKFEHIHTKRDCKSMTLYHIPVLETKRDI